MVKRMQTDPLAGAKDAMKKVKEIVEAWNIGNWTDQSFTEMKESLRTIERGLDAYAAAAPTPAGKKAAAQLAARFSARISAAIAAAKDHKLTAPAAQRIALGTGDVEVLARAERARLDADHERKAAIIFDGRKAGIENVARHLADAGISAEKAGKIIAAAKTLLPKKGN